MTLAYARQLCYQAKINQSELELIVAINSGTDILALQVAVGKLEPMNRL